MREARPEHGGAGTAPSPGTADLTERQAEIIDAATEVFGERGYAGGSMREIASRLGVSEPALYRHFPGKQALFLTALRVVGGRARREVVELVDGIDATNVRERLTAAFENRRQAMQTFAPLLKAVANASLGDERVLAESRAVLALPVIECLTAKAAEIDAALAVPGAEGSRASRVRALLALFVGTMVTSFALGDRPDEAAADAAIRIMQWD